MVLLLPVRHKSVFFEIAKVIKVIFVRLFARFQWFECLQCFDAVGWAAGRASGL